MADWVFKAGYERSGAVKDRFALDHLNPPFSRMMSPTQNTAAMKPILLKQIQRNTPQALPPTTIRRSIKNENSDFSSEKQAF